MVLGSARQPDGGLDEGSGRDGQGVTGERPTDAAAGLPTFMILKLPASGFSTVHVEGYRSNLFLENAEDLRDHEAISDQLRLAGVGGDMLRKLLSDIRRDL